MVIKTTVVYIVYDLKQCGIRLQEKIQFWVHHGYNEVKLEFRERKQTKNVNNGCVRMNELWLIFVSFFSIF
jgi:hypothetical protein